MSITNLVILYYCLTLPKVTNIIEVNSKRYYCREISAKLGVNIMIRIKLSDLMGKHKMTQKDIAKKTGIRPNTVSMYYHETVRHIDINHINELCKLFNCQPGDLFEYIEDENE